jgi:hypothetical protein
MFFRRSEGSPEAMAVFGGRSLGPLAKARAFGMTLNVRDIGNLMFAV